MGKTPLSKLIIFRDAKKLVEMARRGRGLTGIESGQAFDEAVACGRGQIVLLLDDLQLEVVTRRP